MNTDELARRLRAARELAGLSQQDAAEAIGAPRTAVTLIESGKRAVSTLELSRLATRYGRPVSWFLDAASAADEDLLVALHRAAEGIVDDPKVKREIDRCVTLCREGAILEGLLERKPRVGLPDYREPVPRSVGEAIQQGERVAEAERRRLGLGPAPIADLPELVSAQGIWASAAVLPEGVSGLFFDHASVGRAVLVNARQARARQRFSYAHEYAHALLDHGRSVAVTSAANAAELVEKRANAFAAAFLLPAEGVADALRALDKGQPSRIDQAVYDAATGERVDGHLRPAPGSQKITYRDVADIAHQFGASYQAAVYRFKNLRRLSATECDALLAQEEMGRRYLRTLNMLEDLEGEVPAPRQGRELRGQLVHLAIEAYRQGAISRGRILDLGELLEVEGDTLVELAEATRAD